MVDVRTLQFFGTGTIHHKIMYDSHEAVHEFELADQESRPQGRRRGRPIGGFVL
jgi:hypothetical protein